MSEFIKLLKKPIENVLSFVGLVFSFLGLGSLFLSAPQAIGSLSLNYWPLFAGGSILLSIGLSLLYIENKLTKM